MTDLFPLGFLGVAAALGVLLFSFLRPLPLPKALQTSTELIRKGSLACLWRQGLPGLVFFLGAFCALYFLYPDPWAPMIFLSGGICSCLALLLTRWMILRTAPKAAGAAADGIDGAVSGVLSSGAVAGFSAVALGLLHVTGWLCILRYATDYDAVTIAETLFPFGLGASLMGLLSRLTGGIFTASAAMAAPTLEKGDERNPVPVVRTVGNSAGSLRGLTADLFDSYLWALPVSFVLGTRAFPDKGLPESAILLPLVVATVGVLASLAGLGLIKPREVTGQRSLLNALHRGILAAAGIMAVVAAPLSYLLLGSWRPYLAILAGVVAGLVLLFLSELLSSDRQYPAQSLSQSAQTGTAGLLLDGMTIGFGAAAVVLGVVILAALTGFFALRGLLFSETAPLIRGLYGISLTAVGLLSTLALSLTMGAFGPVADTAAALARMSGLGADILARLDSLESTGAPATAAARNYSAGIGVLNALTLLLCCGTRWTAALEGPSLLFGVLLGAVLVYAFTTSTLTGVRRTVRGLNAEIKRQFRTISGLKKGRVEPDHLACVRICAMGSLWGTILPTLLAVLVPVGAGLLSDPNILVGLSLGTTAAGTGTLWFLGAAGGLWEGARRAVENDRRLEKEPVPHEAARCADQVGRPLRDAAAPALVSLIKLCAGVAVLFAALPIT